MLAFVPNTDGRTIGIVTVVCLLLPVFFRPSDGSPDVLRFYPSPSFTGYDYTTPSCPLQPVPPPPCTASATILSVPVKVNVTETIVTFLRERITHTESVTLPVITSTEVLVSTIARTVTKPVVHVEYLTERVPVVEYLTDTVTRTSTCTVTELLPTTYVSTYISTSYAPPLTETSFHTETAYRTLTSTSVSTLIRTQTDTSSVYRTETSSITATKTLREVSTVTATCSSPPPPLNNEYLPVPAPSNDYLPPAVGAEQRLRGHFALPEDLLPPKLLGAPMAPDASALVTMTKTLDPITVTKERTVMKVSPGTPNDLDGGGGPIRTKSVFAFDQRITKRVTVTPTLTSYIYLDPVTVTSTRPSGPQSG
ncbi:mucin-2-like [Anopheles bellator]|uniref:mucin-2-like n=1 Tax=Anopheles bellator TaxID=139047 RepID=UPI00264A3EC2|nr:mucin-2-like [Anopheles bellator]